MTNLSERNLQTQVYKSKEVAEFIPMAIERLGATMNQQQIMSMALDIANEFKNVKTETIKSAIKKGALGEFGRTYKFTTQEVCIWIREEIKYRYIYDENGNKRIVF
jgi:anti-sigma28 factor (negative regulator of flagellin synthesis)